jgi:transcriptional regulator NrdR family protein
LVNMAKKRTAKKRATRAAVHLVKRKGHLEHFDERKVYASVYAACLASHHTEKQAEKVAAAVTSDVKQWMKGKKQVTAHQIYGEISGFLKKHDKNASFMYETHRDVS